MRGRWIKGSDFSARPFDFLLRGTGGMGGGDHVGLFPTGRGAWTTKGFNGGGPFEELHWAVQMPVAYQKTADFPRVGKGGKGGAGKAARGLSGETMLKPPIARSGDLISSAGGTPGDFPTHGIRGCGGGQGN